jgi:hypothetical protein
VNDKTGGHRAWRITRDGRLQALSPEERAEALAAIEQAEVELRAEPGAPTCGHCGRPRRGYGFVDDTALCHTGTLPPDADPADCYRLVVVAGHAADGSCCRKEAR